MAGGCVDHMQVARDIASGPTVLVDGGTPVTERDQLVKFRCRQPLALNFLPVLIRMTGLIGDHNCDTFVEPSRNLAGIPPAPSAAVELGVRPLMGDDGRRQAWGLESDRHVTVRGCRLSVGAETHVAFASDARDEVGRCGDASVEAFDLGATDVDLVLHLSALLGCHRRLHI